MDLNVVGRNTSPSPSQKRLGKARRLIGFAGRNMLPLIQLGTAGMVGLLFLQNILLSVWVARLANRPQPSLVQLQGGRYVEVGSASALHREPLAIKAFVASTLTGLFAWSGTIVKKDDEGKGITRAPDPGVNVRGNSRRGGQVTTASWEAAYGLAEGFRQSFLVQLADMTPKNVFSGQVQSVLDFKYMSEPEIIESGLWRVRVMANWVLYERSGDLIGKALPFNKEVTVQAVYVSPNPLPPGASEIQEHFYNVSRGGMKITRIVDWSPEQ